MTSTTHTSRPGIRRTVISLIVILLVAAAAIFGWRFHLASATAGVVEYPMPVATDIPTASAIAPDGAVWFTIDFSDAIGVIRNGKLERFSKGSRNAEPIGLGVGPDGVAWLADAPGVAIQRIEGPGKITATPLGTGIARLGRLAVAPDGAVWFAESTAYSITRLKDGTLKRHELDAVRGAPFGVAVAPDGAVLATLQAGNSLLRIAPDGTRTEAEIPTASVSPTDIAIDATGAVWFIEFRGNRIGRYADGKFSEVEVPIERAALSGLAAAPDGSVWFGTLRGRAVGRVRDGKVQMFNLPREQARPFSVAVDRAGNVWYADISGTIGMIPAALARR